MEYSLLRFKDTEAGQQSIWEWQATIMYNYLKCLIIHHGFKPWYNDPYGDKGNLCTDIQVDHVAQFCWVMMANIFSGDILINTIFSVKQGLDTVGATKEVIY